MSPVSLVDRYGVDAVRWWLLREVPRVGDADFTVDRLVARYNEDLANGLGNLVNRVVSMVHRYGHPSVGPALPAALAAPALVDAALASFDLRAATAAVWRVVDEGNRYVERVRPWELARVRDPSLDGVLGTLLATCRALGELLAPFLPSAAARIVAACTPGVSGWLPAAEPLFRRL